MANTLQIPLNFNTTTQLNELTLDSTILSLEFIYDYDIEETKQWYDAGLDYWNIKIKDTTGNVFYSGRAVIELNFLKYISTVNLDGILYFKVLDNRISSNIKKNDFINKNVVLYYVTKKEIEENNIVI